MFDHQTTASAGRGIARDRHIAQREIPRRIDTRARPIHHAARDFHARDTDRRRNVRTAHHAIIVADDDRLIRTCSDEVHRGCHLQRAAKAALRAVGRQLERPGGDHDGLYASIGVSLHQRGADRSSPLSIYSESITEIRIRRIHSRVDEVSDAETDLERSDVGSRNGIPISIQHTRHAALIAQLRRRLRTRINGRTAGQ